MRIRPLAIPSLGLALLLHSAIAQAAVLSTPAVHVNSEQHIRVHVTNLGKKGIDVITVTLKNLAGTLQVPLVDECVETAPLEPGSTCRVIYSPTLGFATVETSGGKVRAAINVVDSPSGAVVTVVPATTK